MARNLYETLGLNPNATKDEIKKAYRRAALQTHPDKLPPGASEQDVQESQEKFRKVNNAYEVLSDERKRRIYDKHGEWPPPEAAPEPFSDRSGTHHSNSHNFGFGSAFFGFPPNNPFFASPFSSSSSRPRSRPHDFYAFSDPFTFFDHVFEDVFRDLNDPFFSHRHRSRDAFGRSPFDRDPFAHGSMLMNNQYQSPFGLLPSAFHQSSFPIEGQLTSFSSSRGFPGGDGRWVSQSQMTRCINGVTESVFTRVDAAGNEHVTYSYPDGRERHIVNGIEQGPQTNAEHALPPPPPYAGSSSEPRPERERDRRRGFRDRVNTERAPVIRSGDHRDEHAREKHDRHRVRPRRSGDEYQEQKPELQDKHQAAARLSACSRSR